MENTNSDMDCTPITPNIKRNSPNILVTGTPGVGKSTLCKKLAETTGMQWLEISKIAKDNNCLEEFDEVYKCPVLDEDKLLDGLEEVMCQGGNIVDYHSCEFFPERWFDAVFVIKADNTTLYDRLKARGYEGKKLEDNIDCEIFQVILEEANNSYKKHIVHELLSITESQLQDNINRICLWLQNWFQNNNT
ncbi:adenylate kinase isoenzyme 6 [Euwallacea fornicatus]|uniref:adenylate kinase isoenzyme 6 n=1 Tax=Euwallacea fornicatus TaxID=995702 RepID=UPI00338DAA7C